MYTTPINTHNSNQEVYTIRELEIDYLEHIMRCYEGLFKLFALTGVQITRQLQVDLQPDGKLCSSFIAGEIKFTNISDSKRFSDGDYPDEYELIIQAPDGQILLKEKDREPFCVEKMEKLLEIVKPDWRKYVFYDDVMCEYYRYGEGSSSCLEDEFEPWMKEKDPSDAEQDVGLPWNELLEDDKVLQEAIRNRRMMTQEERDRLFEEKIAILFKE